MGRSVEREIELENVYARLAEKAEQTAFGRVCDEHAHLLLLEAPCSSDARYLRVWRASLEA